MTLLLAAALGIVIGLTLGALGGGGSILTVPALVFVLGEQATDATTASLVIVGVTAAISALSYTRHHQVRWRAGLAFGTSGIASSFLGTAANRAVDQHVLLIAFAALMVAAAIGMLLKTRTRQRADQPAELALVGSGTPDGSPKPLRPEATSTATRRSTVGLQIVLAGLAVGFLTGFLGVGGGFLIVPALVMILRFPMQLAVGTSLLIISINSAASLLARIGHNHFDWSVIVPFTLAAIAGSFAGKRIADRLPSKVLTRAFAVLILLVAIYTAVQAISTGQAK